MAQCPVCRNKFSADQKLPKNYSVIEMIEITKGISSLNIELPEKLQAAGDNDPDPEPICYCRIHNKKIRFFCLNCEKALCNKCFSAEHVKHSLVNPLCSRIFQA